jgi:hypothetical protein
MYYIQSHWTSEVKCGGVRWYSKSYKAFYGMYLHMGTLSDLRPYPIGVAM